MASRLLLETGTDALLLEDGSGVLVLEETFANIRQEIINGLDSAQAEAAGWDAVVKAGIPVANVVRTSDTVVTITLPAFASYNITAQETITATVPNAALLFSGPITGTPTFTVAATSENVTGSGSPTKTLSKSATGAATQTFTGSGAPTKTLSKSATGTATQIFTGSGAPTKTLSKSASGVAVQKFTGSGAPTKTLSKSASGTATNAPDNVTGSGTPAKTLSKSATGVAVQTFTGSGAPTKTLSKSASGVAVQKFTGSGAPTKTLSKSASGAATNTPDAGNVTGSGAPTKTLSKSAVGVAVNCDLFFADIRRNIIDGLESAQSEATGWDAVVKAGIPVSAVVRTSNTVVTITLPAIAGYNITATETITVTVPEVALVVGESIIAAPTFTVKLAFIGSGTPTKTLSKSAVGVAVQKFTGSGAPTKTLSKSATGRALQFDVGGSGAPTKTLSKSATGAATAGKDYFTGYGTPTKTLSKSAVGVASQKFTGSGSPIKTLSKSAVGAARNVGYTGPTWTGGETSGASTATLTLAWPAGHQVDDLALLFLGTSNEVVPSITATGAGTPSNFLAIPGAEAGIGLAGNASAVRMQVYRQRATATNMSKILIADAGNNVSAVMLLFKGAVSTGNVWNAIATAVYSPASTTFTAPGVTPTVDKCLIVTAVTHHISGVAGGRASSIINSSLFNVAEIVDFGHASGNGGGIVIATGNQITAGAVPAFTGTWSESTRGAGVTIALIPALKTTGSGTPIKTLSKSAVGVATRGTSANVTGSGAATKTLSKSATGVATRALDVTGSGAATKTLSKSATGAATRLLDATGSGAPTKTLSKSATGAATNDSPYIPPPVEVPRPPRRATGGGGARRRVFIAPDTPDAQDREPRRPRPPEPRQVIESPELPPPELFRPSLFPPPVLDPVLFGLATLPVRAETGARPQWEIEEEEQFLRYILEMI